MEFAIGIGIGLLWAKTTDSCLCPENDAFHLNINCAKVQFEITHLLSVVFCAVRAVRKSDFKLVPSESGNQWRPVDRRYCSDSGSRVSPTVVACVEGRHAVQNNWTVLSEGQL